MLNVMVTEDLKLLTEENQKLKEEIKILKAYNEQIQNENSYLGEQVDIYKEGYEVSKEKTMKLEAKIEAYKEILRSVLKGGKIMQRFIFEGRLTKDSELKYLPNSNNAVLSFDVAVSEGYGKYKKTDFFNCAVFGKRAESLSSYLIKGTQVICVGEIHINKKDGKQYVSVKVNDIQMLSKKKDDPFDMYKEDKTFEEPIDDGELPF